MLHFQAETVECAPDIAAEPEFKKIERMELNEDEQVLTKDKQGFTEVKQGLTKDNQRSNKDEEDAKDSQNEDQSEVRSEDNGGLLESKKKAEKDDEEEIESLARQKLEQILKSRETLITSNVAEVITLEGDDEDSVSGTMISSKAIENEEEKFKGTENASGEESSDRENAGEQAEEGKMFEEDMDCDKEDVTEGRENKSGSHQPRNPVDHDYEADMHAKVSTDSQCSAEGPDTTTSKSESSNSASVTTEKESSPGASLRLVSLSNLVPNSPPPSQPIGNPTPSWTVAEVA